LVSAGQANDAPVFDHLMAHLRVKRPGSGRARTRPDRVRADKAYSSRAIRTELRRRGITTVIPEPSDQIAHRKRRGPRAGRPPAFDAADYKWRNVIERGFNSVKQWRGLATRYDKLAITYRATPARVHRDTGPIARNTARVGHDTDPIARNRQPGRRRSTLHLPNAFPLGSSDLRHAKNPS